MTAGTVVGPSRLSPAVRGMAVGLAAGLVCLAFAAVLPDDVAYLYLGAQLAGVGWVYFAFGVADGRLSSIAGRGTRRSASSSLLASSVRSPA